MNDSLDRVSAALADRYRIEREIGKGGMARVYLADDLRNDRPVAIKLLRADLSVELAAERFLREITTTANLHHPHILPLYDSGQVIVERAPGTHRLPGAQSSTRLYYVMPYIPGGNLGDRINAEKQLPVDEAIRLTCEIADALQHAHDAGVIHRDVKPANILLQNGHAIVADFGVARAVSMAGTEKITRSGVTVGTPTYMSPEQASGEVDLDGRSDLYALGCVLYETLAGQPPFTGAIAGALFRQHLTVGAAPVSRLRPDVPEPVVRALERALAKAPADRFASVADFAKALTARVGDHAVASPAALRAPRISLRPLSVRLILAIVAIAALAIAMWWILHGAP
ncbi:MAG: serine/threonine-protein kinase [Gemmatimonadales bacterium]